MASVILGTILLSVVVIIVADVPNSVSSAPLIAESLPECHWTDWRLPQNTTPAAYTLKLRTQLEPPYTVTGSVEIELSVPKPTLCVVISAAAMTITGASLLHPALPGAHDRTVDCLSV